MTEQNLPASLIPEGKKPTDLLVIELAYASRKIKCDVMTAIGTPGHPDKAMALAWVACLWARRQEPQAPIERFTGMEYSELLACLGMAKNAQEEAEELDIDGEMKALLGDDEPESLGEAIEANPTDSARA